MILKTARKLISIALSALLIAGASLPSYTQVSVSAGPAPTIIKEMSFAYESLEKTLQAYEHQLLSGNLSPSSYDKHYKDFFLKELNILEDGVAKLKNMGPYAFKCEYNVYSKKFTLFLETAGAGVPVRDAVVKSYSSTQSMITQRRIYNIFDFASGKTVPELLDDAFLDKQLGKIDYDNLLKSFNDTEQALVKFKKNLASLGVSEHRLQAAVLTKISNRVSAFADMETAAKRQIAALNRQLAMLEGRLQAEPANKILLEERQKLRSQKAHELQTTRSSRQKITTAEVTLGEIYKTDSGFRSVVDQMASPVDRKLLSEITKQTPSVKSSAYALHGGWLMTLVLIIVGASVASDAQIYGQSAAGANYSAFIKQQREIDKIADRAPGLLAIMYSNADAAGKKILANLSYKNDNTALNVYLINTEFAYELNGITPAQLNKDIAAAKQMLLAAEHTSKLEGINERIEQINYFL